MALGEDASPPRGLKDEVRTPQTQTGAQRPADPPDSQQTISSISAAGSCQGSHPFAGPAGGLKTPEKHHVSVRSWREPSGQDVKYSPPLPAEYSSLLLFHCLHLITFHPCTVTDYCTATW